MPAGGTWTVQNKQRPGAYIDFVSVAKPVTVIGDRGIVACGLPMTWGPADSIIELLSTDLVDGGSLVKVGCTIANVDESLPYRLLLEKSYKALLYRLDTGGVAASVVLQTYLTIAAKYAGTTGNKITIVIVDAKPEAGKRTISVLVDGVEKETFVATTLGSTEALESEWVTFTSAPAGDATALAATAGAPLVGGTNGAVQDATFTSFSAKIKEERWNCITAQSIASVAATTLIALVKSLRDTTGRKVQGVVYNDVTANHEGIIAVKQGFMTATETVSTALFPLWVAGRTAGSNVNESNTCAEVSGAVTIINPIADADIADSLKLGWFVLSYLQDGTVVVEQDINTFVSFTLDKAYCFSKNRVIRTLDGLANDVTLLFNKTYAGKVDNTSVDRNTFKAQIISYMDTLQSLKAVQNFTGSADVVVSQGETIEAVVVELAVQPVDSMEKLYMTVYVNA